MARAATMHTDAAVCLCVDRVSTLTLLSVSAYLRKGSSFYFTISLFSTFSKILVFKNLICVFSCLNFVLERNDRT